MIFSDKASCQYCGATFMGSDYTKSGATQDALAQVSEHEPDCAINPVNEDYVS